MKDTCIIILYQCFKVGLFCLVIVNYRKSFSCNRPFNSVFEGVLPSAGIVMTGNSFDIMLLYTKSELLKQFSDL
jgi:hypothetical protein